MFRTIMIGNYVSVQGFLVETHADGQVSVRVGNRVFRGYPIRKKAA